MARPAKLIHPGSNWACRLLFAHCFLAALASAQTVFIDFTAAPQFTTNFSLWQDIGGADGGNYAFVHSPTAGVGSSGGISVFQSTDTTATYKVGGWDFSTNGSTIVLSVMIKANGQTSGNKVQLGIVNNDANG